MASSHETISVDFFSDAASAFRLTFHAAGSEQLSSHIKHQTDSTDPGARRCFVCGVCWGERGGGAAVHDLNLAGLQS